MKRRVLLLSMVGLLILFSAQAQISLVKDIANAPVTGNSYPKEFVELNGNILFVATDPIHGSELWRSDGTTAGTYLLKDINPGSNGSTPQYFTKSGNKVYFKANNGSHSNELWVSDGTPDGTLMLKDINPGIDESYPGNFVDMNGILIFKAYTPEYGSELWKTDGTPGGTVMIKDINPGTVSSYPGPGICVNNVVYFAAEDTIHGQELWRSDGTEAGTYLLKDCAIGKRNGTPHAYVNLNNQLIFVAFDTIHGFELWKSDGTTAGTFMYCDINPGYCDTTYDDIPSQLIVYNNKVYFQSAFESYGQELFVSDGTEAGTYMLKDIDPADASRPGNFAIANNLLFFTADVNGYGRELFKTNGTAAGTVMIKDIWPGNTSGYPLALTAMGNYLFFAANDSLHGEEIWRSNGTTAGTVMVKDIYPGTQGSTPSTYGMGSSGEKVFFCATDGTIVGRELYATDGTMAGTTLIKDIYSGSAGSEPLYLTALNGNVFFTAIVDTYGRELFISDGTTSGTQLLKDIRVGSSSSSPLNLITFGNKLLFTANNGSSGTELWSSDGTTANTSMIKDICPWAGSSPQNFIQMGNYVYFDANDCNNGTELWKTDGTTAGTTMVKDITPGSNGSSFGTKFLHNNHIYFNVWSNSIGFEPWASDGTEIGTFLLKDIAPGNRSGSPSKHCNLDTLMLFNAYDSIHANELWISDGTEAGTHLLKDINTGENSSNPNNLTSLDSLIVFTAFQPETGTELWVTNGTSDGTHLLKDFSTGPSSSNLSNFFAFNNQIFFSAFQAATGYELWVTDGSIQGTYMVKDINPGDYSSNPSDFVVIDNKLYFYANDGSHGIEVWTSDGSEVGSFLVSEGIEGIDNLNARKMVANGSHALFCAQNSNSGYELWRFDPHYVSVTNVNTDSVCVGAEISVIFEAVGTYNSGNSFVLQMSDSNGNFDNPTIINSISALESDTIIGNIPGTIDGGTYVFRVVATSPETNRGAISQSVVINPLPQISIDNVSPICINATPIELSHGQPSGGSYSGVGVSSNFFNPALCGSGETSITYSLTQNSCTNTVTYSITVSPLPAANHSITGEQSICQGQQNVVYQIEALDNTDSYAWTLPDGATGNSNTNSISVNFGLNAMSGNISVTGHNNCGDGQTISLPITVNPLPAANHSITGEQSICQGQQNVMYQIDALDNTDSYIWTLPDGASGNSNTNSISVNFGLNAMSGNISVTGHNNCGDGQTISLPISINPLPAANHSITGEQSICQGQQNVVYQIEALDNTDSYAWTLPDGATGNSNTNSISVNFGLNAMSGNISVTGHNNCGDGQTISLPITVNPLPAANHSITGEQSICQGQQNVMYQIDALDNTDSYIWTLPDGASGNSNTNSISVNFGLNAMSGNISVTGHNNCGDGQTISLPISINPLPAANHSITGEQSICQGQQNVVYQIEALDNADSYIWTLPDGASGNSNTNSISVNFGLNAMSGNISVTGHNNCGDGQTISLPISINPLPAANHSITGEQSICQGQQNVMYQIDALDNADSYVWTLPNGATGNSNTNSISVNFGLNAVSGNISVTGHNNCGDGQTISLHITVNPLPETPSITMENQTLISSSAEGNQWYNQLGIIEGATEQIFSPQEDGDYYVIVTLNGCMSNPSNMIHVSLIGIQTIAGNEIVIYPNPADTWVQIEFEKEIHAKIEIHNTLGQIVNATYVAPRQPIDVSNLAPGMYIVKISQEGRKFQSKLIIK